MPARKVIITCAVTGSIHTPSMSPHLPITAEEIAEAAIGAAEAGAAIVHLHARNARDGSPDQSLEAFSPFLKVIKQKSDVVINITTGGSQTMTVDVMGQRVGQWAVSTAGRGYHTPHGFFHAIRMARVYYSRKYDNSPMPNSVFFSGGNAIHGTYHIHSLGHPASHGCVRLLPQHAAELYNLVASYGMNRTRIIVSD